MKACAVDFVEALAKDSSLSKNVNYDEKKGLFIVKAELSKKYENFRVEIIFRIFNHLTFPKNEDVISNYIKIYPQARPLYLIIRSILHKAHLDDPGTNGINNFSIFLMIIAFCQKFDSFNQTGQSASTKISSLESGTQNQSKTFKSSNTESNFSLNKHTANYDNIKNEVSIFQSATPQPQKMDENLGDILLKLLYFYGYTFDYVRTQICPFLPSDSIQEAYFQVI